MGEDVALPRAFPHRRIFGALLVGVGLCLAMYSVTLLHVATKSSPREASRDFAQGCRAGAVFGGAYGSTVQAK